MGVNWTQAEYDRYLQSGKTGRIPFRDKAPGASVQDSPSTPEPPSTISSNVPNKGERYIGEFLRFLRTDYESRSFTLPSGHKYTPDWTDKRRCVEVKGHRHFSIQRARLAFDECRVAHPELTWIWAEKKKAAKLKPERWVLEVYLCNVICKAGTPDYSLDEHD